MPASIPIPSPGARAVPIYQTTSYVFDDTDHAAALFNLERAGPHLHAASPTRPSAVLEERLAALEGGVGAVCTASGMAALHLAIATLLGAGDHIVASASLYGGTINLLTHTLPRFGITTSSSSRATSTAFAPRSGRRPASCIGETIGNPGLEVLDIPAVAEIAHDAGHAAADRQHLRDALSLPPDRAWRRYRHAFGRPNGSAATASPSAARSSTAAASTGSASGKFPTLTEPYAGYHGIVFAEQFGPAAFVMRARAEGLRDFGACLSPTNAFQLLQGVETLGAAHGAAHREHRGACWTSCADNPAVAWVAASRRSPSHPDHALAKTTAAARRGLHRQLRHQGRPRRPAAIHRRAAARQPSRQCRRRQDAGHPSRQHDASADERRAARRRRDRRGHGAAVGRASKRADDIIDDLGQALRASQKALSGMQTDRRRRARSSSRTGGRDVRSDAARRRLPARRRHRSHGLGAAQPLVRPSRPWRAGARSARPRRLGGPPLADIAAMADWTAALLDAAGARAARLIGHSMGSLIALETAARHPDRVSRLGLIGVAAPMPVLRDLLAGGGGQRSRRHRHGLDLGPSATRRLGGSRAPGLWMLGGAAARAGTRRAGRAAS